jgi:hypothetical protein
VCIVRIIRIQGVIMIYPRGTAASSGLSVEAFATEQRFSLYESQRIVYDAAAINAAIMTVLGPEPERGARNAHAWGKDRDRLFNHELDLLRTVSGASVSQTITFEPIQAPLRRA